MRTVCENCLLRKARKIGPAGEYLFLRSRAQAKLVLTEPTDEPSEFRRPKDFIDFAIDTASEEHLGVAAIRPDEAKRIVELGMLCAQMFVDGECQLSTEEFDRANPVY